MSIIITFPARTGTPYTAGDVNLSMPKGTVSLLNRTGPELASLYNLVASNLGSGSVARFKDNKTAVKRTWAMLVMYQNAVAAETAQDATGEAAAAATPTAPAAAAVTLTPEDQKQVADEAASRKAAPAKRGSQAGTIRKPREPKADDGAIKMPKAGGSQRAKRQKDGSYAFLIPAGKPRTKTISEQREELLGLLVEGTTWQGIKDAFGKDDFKTVTTVTMFCITLGYGLETQADGTIKLIEPLA